MSCVVFMTINVVSSNPADGKVYLIQHCVVKLVTATGPWFSPPIKLKYFENGVKHHNHNLLCHVF
jgi:hypothetical protein